MIRVRAEGGCRKAAFFDPWMACSFSPGGRHKDEKQRSACPLWEFFAFLEEPAVFFFSSF
jgi:hypothetical protein